MGTIVVITDLGAFTSLKSMLNGSPRKYLRKTEV